MNDPDSQRIHVDTESSSEGPGHSPALIYGALLALAAAAGVVLISLTRDGLTAAAGTTSTTFQEPIPGPPEEDFEVTTTALPPSNETSLGTLVWTDVDVRGEPLPAGVIYANHSTPGYFIYGSHGDVFWSPDGLTWAKTAASSPFEGPVFFDGDWAVEYGFRQTLYHYSDGWSVLTVPDPPMPVPEGLVWQWFHGTPVTSDGTIVLPAAGQLRVPWENIYGLFQLDCGQKSACEEPPWELWSTPHELRLNEPGTNETLAILAVDQVGVEVVFTDSVTGERIWTVMFGDEAAAADYLNQASTGAGPLEFGAWAGSSVSDLVFHEMPWPDQASVTSAGGDGFVAFSLNGREGAAVLWTSSDGIIWTDRGTPEFAAGAFRWASVSQLGDTLFASLAGAAGPSLWTSTDGLEWVPVDTNLPGGALLRQPGFGYLGVTWDGSTFSPRLWVSGDGVRFEEVPGPPRPSEGGYSDLGAVGDLLYLVPDLPDGPRLWIGRFEN